MYLGYSLVFALNYKAIRGLGRTRLPQTDEKYSISIFPRTVTYWTLFCHSLINY